MRQHLCKFCEKGFGSEKTLAVHMCVKKKRWAERDMIGARLGFRVFQRFYELTTNSKKPKSQEDFIDSKFYSDFVRFGRYLVELNPINADAFIDFVIRNGVKLKEWTADFVYDSFLEDFMKSEGPEMALERTILEMQEWANENKKQFSDFFKEVNANEATFLIRAGRISPWVLYLAPSADELFARLSPEQGKIINSVIDPSRWQARFMLKKDDVKFVTELLEEAGL